MRPEGGREDGREGERYHELSQSTPMEMKRWVGRDRGMEGTYRVGDLDVLRTLRSVP